MMFRITLLLRAGLLAGLLAGANAMAAGSPSAASTVGATDTTSAGTTSSGTTTTTATTTSGATTATATNTAPAADLEAQLAAARQRLEAAARDVGQLSAQLGRSAMLRVRGLRTRAVLGLQLKVEPSAREQGATILGVSPGGPAAEAGLAAGDVIVALDGTPIGGPDASREVVDRMDTVKPDTRITVKVMRDGKPKQFHVTPRAGAAGFFARFNGPGPNPGPGPGAMGEGIGRGPGGGPGGPGGPGGSRGPNAVWQQFELRREPGAGVGAVFEGMELADLSPSLGRYFGTSQGVLVIRAPRDDAFLKLRDGDVILSIDGRVPENGPHATRILRSYQRGEKIHLKVLRQKKSLELEGTLPERRHFGPRGRAEGPAGGAPAGEAPSGDAPASGADDRGPGPEDRAPPDRGPGPPT